MNVRLVATHYLAILSPQLYLPSVWEFKEFWHSRIIYTALRDAIEVEKLMTICMPWSTAREYAFSVVFSLFTRTCLLLLDAYRRASRLTARREIEYYRFSYMS